MYHAKGFNSSALGIEVVGPGVHLDRSGKDKSLRDQVTDLNLSPELESRLLGYSDKQLNNVVKWNGDTIYEDISGAQKRSVWNLTSNLANDYGLDLSSLSTHGAGESGANHYSRKNLPDFSAHEHINPKSLGEGEPMVEFLRARQQYPQLVAQAEQRLAALRTSGYLWNGVRAADLADAELELDPGNGNAAHALTHVHYETDAHGAGLKWLTEWIAGPGTTQRYLPHFQWHAALHELAMGDAAAAARRAQDAGLFVVMDRCLWRDCVQLGVRAPA